MMSYVKMDIKLSDIEKEILYGISTTVQELRKNYEIIIKANFNVNIEEYNPEEWDEEHFNLFVVKNNPDGSGWSNDEFKSLIKEKVHLERLFKHLESILNDYESLDTQGVIDIIEEDRRAEKIENLLEKKQENGNLEMGGKNTVRLTKALTELSKCLKQFEESSSVDGSSVENSKIVGWLDNLEPPAGVEGKNADYIFGGIKIKGGHQPSFDEESYAKSDYIVLDSLDFSFKENGFEDFIKEQPGAGRFNYEELIAENVFKDRLPVIIPDVLPIGNFKGINLNMIDKYAGAITGAAAIPGNTVLPAAYGAALAGALPYQPVFLGIVTWKAIFMFGLPSVLIPRLLTGVAARMALFCEKLEKEFAVNSGGNKPTFYLYTNKKEAALIAAFAKFPELRRRVIEIHSMLDFGGLNEQYLNYMEEVKFSGTPSDIPSNPMGGNQLRLQYKGEQALANYKTRKFETDVV